MPTKTPKSTTAPEPHAAFNGADPAAFDHDQDGRPGGSAPAADAGAAAPNDTNAVRLPFIDPASGALVLLAEGEADDAYRLATAIDVQIAGRPDLLPLVGPAD